MSERVKEYRRLIREHVAKRAAAPGGELSDDEESDWVERCESIWQQMTWEERDEAETEEKTP